ncbi:MAG: hypothetical protein JJU19_01030 [Pararhodobacter sp.]|nr:hypothetical protein [Pararhodobacter sp.]
MYQTLLVAGALSLAACGAVPPWSAPSAGTPTATIPVTPVNGTTPRATADTCGAARFRHLIGTAVPDPFPFSGPLRLFRSGDMLTMDHRPERMNVELDRNSDTILAIYCG